MRTVSQIWQILTKKERIAFLVLFLGMLGSSILEIFGLAILVPVVNLVAYPDQAIETSWYLRLFLEVFPIPPDNTTLLLGSVILFVAAVYVLKGAYFILFSTYQSRLVQRFSRRLSVELFANYLYQPYEFHVYHNSTELISHVIYDVNVFVSGIGVILTTLSDILFCLITFVYLMISEWAITLVIFIGLGAMSLFLTWLLRKKAKQYGAGSKIANETKFKSAQQGLAGIKETKIANKEAFFIKEFEKGCRQGQFFAVKQAVMSVIPRTIVEAIGVIGMLAGLYVYYLLGNPPEAILSTFTLLALAVVKLLPYVSRIAGQINYFRTATASINQVYRDVTLAKESRHAEAEKEQLALPFENSVKIENLSFQYRGGTEAVIQNANVIIPKGKSVAFCGRSGAGKTTLVDLILGLLKPQYGQILCDDKNVQDSLCRWHNNLSYVPQDIYLLDDTMRANVAFGEDNQNTVSDEKIWEALEKAQLAEFVRSLPNQLDSMIGEKGVRLSGGQRQRIGIARALYRNTPILILDEATSALDYQTESEILQSVQKLQGEKTLIIITHRLNTIEGCDLIYEIKENHVSLIKQ